MPRGGKQDPGAASVPSEAVAGKPGAKVAKAKAIPLGVSKPPLKKQEPKKEVLKAAAAGAADLGGLDLVELEKKRKELSEQLRKCELQIHRLESQYFESANPQGNALKGYEGLLSSTAVNTKKARFGPEDRIFSGSSVSGNAARSGSG
ncbi:hypothetical protein GPECTOR_6g818 [Gonium pectorale]|uniref:Chromatin modification-related protein MEAF6 n=1 Tax=Gonium pectorale TaxID=33097 RepID=A0A150GWZ9_GONPE|nr:hypothetical protein GPECTOR_6g818 [Gonium pectorale]|eukprot:KXZ53900.1 hypothetical protein GPECTOR_6g818 [Gonium pectorale]